MERVTATPALLLALLVAIAYNAADRTALSSQIASLEAERDSLHSRVELVEQAFTALLTQPSAAAALPARRLLEDAPEPDDRATVRVDAPDGVSEIILGGEAAADNVVLRKAHERDGAAFTLSRSDTQVLRVDPAGNVTVLTDPLQVSGTVKVGGSLEVGGELLLGGVRLSAAALSALLLNAGPLPPPAPPPAPPSPPMPPLIVSSINEFPQNRYPSSYCPSGRTYKRHACGTNAEASLTSGASAEWGPFFADDYLDASYASHCSCCCSCNAVWIECV